MANAPCRICHNQAEYIPDLYFPEWHCPRCGKFDYDTTLGWLEVKSQDHMVRLSGWVREQNAAGVTPVRITVEISRRVAEMSLPGLRERANRALAVIAREYPDPEITTAFNTMAADKELLAVTYSAQPSDAMPLIFILRAEKHLSEFVNSTTQKATEGAITAKGMIAADELRASAPRSAQGFVAMQFSEAMRDAWINGFEPGIRMAGFRPLRIDAKDYVGGITDEIISEVRRSRFVIADYTGQVNGVYFEAGFALGLGITVIPTCQSDDLERLHFDIKHLNTLLWKTPAELAMALDKRIRAVLGAGPDAA